MNPPNPIDLLFAGMDKLSPGDDNLSLYVLRSLPEHHFEVVVDAGCGAGRQTFVLANELKTLIHAVELINHSWIASANVLTRKVLLKWCARIV
jgi:methylase of polypeptide subunit release factors